MEYIIVFLALLGGVLLGILSGWFWFSKGKKISSALQTQIDEQERSLRTLESKLN
ncbi:MAG: hypothetical protein AAB489_00720 [Patescibacteria group bacterium]